MSSKRYQYVNIQKKAINDHLSKKFNAKTTSKGIDYFINDHVVECNYSYQAQAVVINAVVSGTNPKPYICSLKIYQTAKVTSITGKCTCPVGFNCKHCVAAYVEYAYINYIKNYEDRINAGMSLKYGDKTAIELENKRQAEQKIQNWLQFLSDTNKDNHKTYEKHKKKIIYMLFPAKRNSNEVVIQQLKVSLLKKGGFGAITEFKSPLPTYDSSQLDYNETDVFINRLIYIETMNYNGYYNSVILKGKMGQVILENALNTGKIFWNDHEFYDEYDNGYIPIKYTDELRNIYLNWKSYNNIYRPKLNVKPKIEHIFIINNEYYYIANKGTVCGKAMHDSLSPKQLTYLLNAPPIAEEQVDDVRKHLSEIFKNVDIELPGVNAKQIKAIDIKCQCIPCLLVQQKKVGDYGTLFASLAFDYDGHTVATKEKHPVQVITNNTEKIRIYRNIGLEDEHIKTLGSYGLVMGDDMNPDIFKPLEFVKPFKNSDEYVVFWESFLSSFVRELEQKGWRITIDEGVGLEIDCVEDIEAQWVESDASSTWFELTLGFEVDEKPVNLLPILVELLGQMESPSAFRAQLQSQPYMIVPFKGNRWLKLESTRITSILDTLVELYDKKPLNADGSLTLSRHQGATLAAGLINNQSVRWKGADELLELAKKLQNFDGITPVQPPVNLQTTLRLYQQKGLDWLQFLRQYKFSGVLADDMGLGKTVQALTHLLLEKQEGRMDRPSLIVAPTSLMGNWRREAGRFAPNLKTLVLHGADRKQHFENLADFDLIFTSYPLIRRDEELYATQRFYYLILDEAQAIKNVSAQVTQILCGIQAQHRFCLTGTPVENHLGELWSMFNFLMPGYLGTHDKFTRIFRTPIEKHRDNDRQQQLRTRIKPFMLRRTKDVVAAELPPKTEIVRTVSLDGKQRDLYETVRIAMEKKVISEISKKGFARSQIMILDALLKLRQVCCDPRLVNIERAKKVKESAKLDLLMSILNPMVEEGRKILLFSQFTSMLELIEEKMQESSIAYTKLTGRTKNRDATVSAFQDGNANVFLISLKAGGTGLNLTAADIVIHYDPWWNPAVEQQATDRAYRIGQDKPVFVYKLITENTIEEKILKLQEKKQAVVAGIYDGKSTEGDARFNSDELMELLKPIS